MELIKPSVEICGVSGPVHPNAKLIAKPLKQEFIKRGYI